MGTEKPNKDKSIQDTLTANYKPNARIQDFLSLTFGFFIDNY